MRPEVEPSRVLEVIRGLLGEYPDPLDEAAAAELRARLVDMDEVRDWFAGHPEVQQLCADALRRAGGQQEALTAALEARREVEDAATLRRFRWALWAVLEARLPLDPAACPDPEDLDAWMVGGHLLGEFSRLREAAAWFARVLDEDPEHVEARALHAWTRWLLDMEPRWQDEIAELLAAHPRDPLLAELAAEMGPRAAGRAPPGSAH